MSKLLSVKRSVDLGSSQLVLTHSKASLNAKKNYLRSGTAIHSFEDSYRSGTYQTLSARMLLVTYISDEPVRICQIRHFLLLLTETFLARLLQVQTILARLLDGSRRMMSENCTKNCKISGIYGKHQGCFFKLGPMTFSYNYFYCDIFDSTIVTTTKPLRSSSPFSSAWHSSKIFYLKFSF